MEFIAIQNVTIINNFQIPISYSKNNSFKNQIFNNQNKINQIHTKEKIKPTTPINQTKIIDDNFVYNSNKENINYYSKILNNPKSFNSFIGNYKFFCSYNSYKNKREYNEDKILITSKKYDEKTNINFFGIFDGHSGNKCSSFLMKNFDKFLFSNTNLISDTSHALKETYLSLDKKFYENNKPKNLLIPPEKSGSCALSILTINNKIYCANAGDSRAIYSENSSKEVYQISYEHKPENELKRIIKSGGKIYSSFNGKIWRIYPGNLGVRIFLNIYF